LSRETEPAGYVCVQGEKKRERDFKELPDKIVEIKHLQSRIQEKSCSFFQGSLLAKFLPAWQRSVFVLRLSAYWMSPTHMVKAIFFILSPLI
jgi:hypothetical protein